MATVFLNYLPLLGTIFLIIFYIIQIGKTLKVKSTKGVSMLGWATLNLALLVMFLNSVVVFIQFHTYGGLIEESANVILALIELGLIIKYRKN